MAGSIRTPILDRDRANALSRNDACPLVSVVIPTYNRASVICRTIDNVLEQTYPNVEVIIVDDGSTDDTEEKLRAYANRIRIIRQPNAGPSAARNRGIEAARGEFIALQDSDDLWVPQKLTRQVALLQTAGELATCCFCNALLRHTDGREQTAFEEAWLFPPCSEGVWTNVRDVLATRFVFFCQTALIRREVLERIGGFDETLKFHEDYELPLRLALEGPWVFIGDPLTVWNQGSPESWSQKALREEIEMRRCEIRMREGILSGIEGRQDLHHFKRLLRWELRRNYFVLRAAELERGRHWCGRLVARFLKGVDRYSRAVYRRTPWYPKFEATALVECSNGTEVST